ncbi:MAG: hypothetical protein KBS60_04215 [Phascolarctobacterium sp.]|nr:hypothetical protein [Candidatus Phascolarctobacterium caballi]
MDKYLRSIAIFLVLYIVVDLIIFCIKGCEPSTLTMYIFIAATGECGFMGWIKTAKTKQQEREWQKEDEHNK